MNQKQRHKLRMERRTPIVLNTDQRTHWTNLENVIQWPGKFQSLCRRKNPLFPNTVDDIKGSFRLPTKVMWKKRASCPSTRAPPTHHARRFLRTSGPPILTTRVFKVLLSLRNNPTGGQRASRKPTGIAKGDLQQQTKCARREEDRHHQWLDQTRAKRPPGLHILES